MAMTLFEALRSAWITEGTIVEAEQSDTGWWVLAKHEGGIAFWAIRGAAPLIWFESVKAQYSGKIRPAN